MWWMANATPRPLYPPGKTRYPLYRRLGEPQTRSGQVRKISPPTGIRSPDRPARRESLYRLNYPGSGNRYTNNKTLRFGAQLCFRLQIRSTKSVTTRGQVLFSGVYLPLWVLRGSHWLRIAWSKGFSRLGASCLKTGAQPASETQCYSIYISVTP